ENTVRSKPPDSVPADPACDRSEQLPIPRPWRHVSCSSRLLNEIRADHQSVQRRRPKRLQRIARGTDHGLATRIERGIDENGYTRAFFKRSQEIVVTRVLIAPYCLYACRAVDVAHGGNLLGAFR